MAKKTKKVCKIWKNFIIRQLDHKEIGKQRLFGYEIVFNEMIKRYSQVLLYTDLDYCKYIIEVRLYKEFICSLEVTP